MNLTEVEHTSHIGLVPNYLKLLKILVHKLQDFPPITHFLYRNVLGQISFIHTLSQWPEVIHWEQSLNGQYMTSHSQKESDSPQHY